MVDCRPAAGAPPHEMHQHPHNGAQHENHHAQAAGGGVGGDNMAAHGVASPSSVRASTPATANSLAPYSGNQSGNAQNSSVSAATNPSMPYACSPYACKPLVWCTQPPFHPLPPPPGVNPHVSKSVQASGADLPMNDMATLRYFFNLGVDCMWAAYPPPTAPPRQYMARDLAQDMQQVSLHDRPNMNHGAGEQNHKHKPQQNDKPPLNNQGKGNGPRPLVGPRFKRGGNQDGNQSNNHNQNKGHNSNMGNKGPNNRRNSYSDNRNPPQMSYNNAEGDCMIEQPLLTIPYIPYPPPIYPIPYYPVESDPAMMGMMGGMGYVGYDEGVEYGHMQPYYPAPYPPAHAPPPHVPAHAHHAPQGPQHHHDHK